MFDLFLCVLDGFEKMKVFFFCIYQIVMSEGQGDSGSSLTGFIDYWCGAMLDEQFNFIRVPAR